MHEGKERRTQSKFLYSIFLTVGRINGTLGYVVHQNSEGFCLHKFCITPVWLVTLDLLLYMYLMYRTPFEPVQSLLKYYHTSWWLQSNSQQPWEQSTLKNNYAFSGCQSLSFTFHSFNTFIYLYFMFILPNSKLLTYAILKTETTLCFIMKQSYLFQAAEYWNNCLEAWLLSD